jgi:hypothetical protein
MNSYTRFFTLTVFTTIALSAPSFAQDRIFNYTYQSTVLPTGKAEFEVWNTFRWQRGEFYRALDQRIEFEIGIAKNLQASFYLNLSTKAFKEEINGYSADAVGRLVITPTPTILTETDLSFSNEWKWKLSDPVADIAGLALYGELSLGRQATEIEAKIILDKTIDRFTTAFNVVGEVEFESELGSTGDVESEKEYGFELDCALAYSVCEGFNLGIEAVNNNTLTSKEWEHSALFLGPTFSFYTENFWVNLTMLPQIAGLKGATKDGLVLSERERLQTRLLFSYAL